jgi:hypothetical protein
MNLARELSTLEPRVGPSAWEGHEHVRGYGVMSLPFSSGHVLGLRVFPENDFAPYVTVWHRTPEGAWSIYVDGAPVEAACPRYFGPGLRHAAPARIGIAWTGRRELHVTMDEPSLDWTLTVEQTPFLALLNAISRRLPLASWRPRPLLAIREWIARRLLRLGEIRLSGPFPSGQAGIMMPQRIYRIPRSTAVLEGLDLGVPAVEPAAPTVGGFPFPARPTFAIGQAHIRIDDVEDYERLTPSGHAGSASTR